MNVDQQHVGPVEGLEVAAVQHRALAGDGVARAQQLGDPRVAHGRPNLAAHELRCRGVGLFVDHEIVEAAEEQKSAILPALLVDAFALGGIDGQRRDVVARPVRELAALLPPVAGAEAGVVVLDRGHQLGVDRLVARRHRVLRGALKHHQLARLPGDHRDRLHRRRAGADNPDPLAAEVHSVVRPVAGVIGGAGERVGLRRSTGWSGPRGSRLP